MDSLPPEVSHTDKDNSRWPAAPILFYGTFGSHTKAGALYHKRCWAALAALILLELVALAFRGISPQASRLAAGLLPGVMFTYIVVAFRSYLKSLDELARRMQMEAMAWTYLFGLAAASLLGGFGVQISPFWYVILEPVRGIWLYCVSRRY